MAAKRILQSSTDWAALAKLVPPDQQPVFGIFKARSDNIIKKMLALPVNPPDIHWDYYKTNTLPSGKAIVEQLEKNFKEFKVPYPPDTFSPALDDLENKMMAYVKENELKLQDKEREIMRVVANRLSQLPYEEMTMEDYAEAFPKNCISEERPTLWPHHLTYEEQMERFKNNNYYSEESWNKAVHY